MGTLLKQFMAGVGGGRSWISYWEQQIFQEGETFDEGKVVLQFDDGWGSVYDNGLPIFIAKDVPATIFCNARNIDTLYSLPGVDDTLTWEEAETLANAGMDLQCHGYGGAPLETLTDEEIADEYIQNNSRFAANGLTPPRHTAYSDGSYNDNSLDFTSEYRDTGRTTLAGWVKRNGSYYEMKSPTSTTVEKIKANMDIAKRDKSAYLAWWHMVGIDHSLSISTADLSEVIDYGKSIGLDFITTSELYNLMFYIDIRLSRDCPDDQIDITCKHKCERGESISIERSTDGVSFSEIHVLEGSEVHYSDTGLTADTVYYYRARAIYGETQLPYSRIEAISTPITITVTSTGSGTGVATFTLKTLRDEVLSIDGSGRFYTNEAGTEGESTSVNLIRDTQKTVYVKVSSGTANMTLSANTIHTIYNWIASTNAPSISFDIAKLTFIESIYITGLNTIYGSITGLKLLTSLTLYGTNTISGDITDKLFLQTLDVTGNNALTGDVSNLTSLTYLFVGGGGASLLTGNVTDLVKLTRLYAKAGDTIGGDISNLVLLTNLNAGNTTSAAPYSGDISGLIKLKYLAVSGANTITGDISGLVDLATLILLGTNTISGSIAGLVKLTDVSISGNNTVSGNIDNLTLLTSLYVTGNNTISGDLGAVVNGITGYVNLVPCAMTTYTGGAVWSGPSRVIISPSAGYGYDQTEVANVIIDINNGTSVPSSKIITLGGSNASMADTTQGGIWGDFEGETSPSALATAYKNLIRVRSNTVTLNGITVPGGSGDGTGFPAGFGDWYRS